MLFQGSKVICLTETNFDLSKLFFQKLCFTWKETNVNRSRKTKYSYNEKINYLSTSWFTIFSIAIFINIYYFALKTSNLRVNLSVLKIRTFLLLSSNHLLYTFPLEIFYIISFRISNWSVVSSFTSHVSIMFIWFAEIYERKWYCYRYWSFWNFYRR